MKKQELLNYLSEYLKINEFTDKAKNWLQVDNTKKEIKRIWYAVDATTYIFDKATKEKVDLVLVHHGMFWWIEQILTWVSYQRIQKLIKNDIWLYCAHIPLDAHEEVWNNIWLAKAFVSIFWLKEKDYTLEEFWEYDWSLVWYWLKFNKEINISDIVKEYAEEMQLQKELYNFSNKEFIKSVAFISWWWWPILMESKDKWYDLFITWEAKHSEICLAKELWQSILLWWHRETEKIWPELLTNHIKEKFWLETVFLDEKY